MCGCGGGFLVSADDVKMGLACTAEGMGGKGHGSDGLGLGLDEGRMGRGS